MLKMDRMEAQACAMDSVRNAEILALRKELQAVKQKKESKVYAQTWETDTTPETHKPIARVTKMLEQGKKVDDTQGYIEMFRGLPYGNFSQNY